MRLILWLITVAGMFVSATMLNRYWIENPMSPDRIIQGMPTQELYLMIALAVCIVLALYMAIDEIRRSRRGRL